MDGGAMIRLTPQEKRAIATLNGRGHKYNAQRTTIDNITFASKAEARRYAELTMLVKAGEITDLEIQPKFPLLVGQRPKKQIGEYRADFQYVRDGEFLVVEDVKGFKTALYRWKKKHVEAQYGITITEVA